MEILLSDFQERQLGIIADIMSHRRRQDRHLSRIREEVERPVPILRVAPTEKLDRIGSEVVPTRRVGELDALGRVEEREAGLLGYGGQVVADGDGSEDYGEEEGIGLDLDVADVAIGGGDVLKRGRHDGQSVGK